MEEKLKKMTEESITRILDEGITTNNLDHLLKLSKINHIAKEDKNMYSEYGNYGEYGARGGRGGSYGEYREGYGARGRRRRYRGDDSMERMSEEYGRYQESRSYGNNEETDKSFYYMVKALEDFVKVLEEEADTQQQKQQLRQALQNSMR